MNCSACVALEGRKKCHRHRGDEFTVATIRELVKQLDANNKPKPGQILFVASGTKIEWLDAETLSVTLPPCPEYIELKFEMDVDHGQSFYDWAKKVAEDKK